MNSAPAERKSRHPQPGELWSLLAVLKLYATSFLAIGEHLGTVELVLGFDERSEHASLSEGEEIDPLLAEHLQFTPEEEAALVALEGEEGGEPITPAKEALAAVIQLARRLELPVSAALIAETISDAKSINLAEYRLLKKALYTEIKGRPLFFIPAERARFFENKSVLSKDARRSFPTAYTELREAGSCFAAGRYTATVLHAMRAAEVGVKALSVELGHNPPDIKQLDWHPLLEKCDSIIAGMKALPKGQKKEDDLKFYSRAVSQLRYFKDGWRIDAAHTRPLFSENEAKDIFLATIAFYEAIWPRLKE